MSSRCVTTTSRPRARSRRADTTLVSWLPVYHDMGLLLGITGALTMGLHSVLMSPMAFLQRPARWVQEMANNTRVFTAVPNFAFELAARRTTDEDMAGLDLSGVHTILSGSERVHAATIRRFVDRFSPFGFPASSLKPSYGLAEAMVYVNSSGPGRAPTVANFDYEKLSAGHAEACDERDRGRTGQRRRPTRLDDSHCRPGDPRREPGRHGRRNLAPWR